MFLYYIIFILPLQVLAESSEWKALDDSSDEEDEEAWLPRRGRFSY